MKRKRDESSGGKSRGKSSGGKSRGKSSGGGGKSTGKGKGKGTGAGAAQTGGKASKSSGKAGKSSSGKGKGKSSSGKGKTAGSEGAEGKGKGKRTNSKTDGLTRKDRKGKGKGKGPAKAAADGDDRKGKGKGKDWKKDHFKNAAQVTPDAGQGQGKKKRYKRLGKKKTPLVPDMPPPLCQRGHKMVSRTENPAGYTNKACCDVCALVNLPMMCERGKLLQFFHCNLCRFDICPRCATAKPGEENGGKENDKKRRVWDGSKYKLEPANANAKEEDEPTSGGKKKQKKTSDSGGKTQQKPAEEGFNRARRDTWLPSEAESVNRAPLKASVVSDFVEGVPV